MFGQLERDAQGLKLALKGNESRQDQITTLLQELRRIFSV
jgi:hypothetical protein